MSLDLLTVDHNSWWWLSFRFEGCLWFVTQNRGCRKQSMHHNNDTGCWDVHCNTLWTCVRIFVIREREIGLPQNYQWPLAAKYQAIHNQRNICSRIFTDNSCSTVWHKMASRQPELSETFFSKQETVICSHKMKCKQIELKWNSDEDHRTLEFGGANCDHLMGAVDEQFNHLLLHFRLWSGVKMSPSTKFERYKSWHARLTLLEK